MSYMPTRYNYLLTFADGSKWHTGYVYNDDDDNDSNNSDNNLAQRPLSCHHSLSLRGVCGVAGSSNDVCADLTSEAEILDNCSGESE